MRYDWRSGSRTPAAGGFGSAGAAVGAISNVGNPASRHAATISVTRPLFAGSVESTRTTSFVGAVGSLRIRAKCVRRRSALAQYDVMPDWGLMENCDGSDRSRPGARGGTVNAASYSFTKTE